MGASPKRDPESRQHPLTDDRPHFWGPSTAEFNLICHGQGNCLNCSSNEHTKICNPPSFDNQLDILQALLLMHSKTNIFV